MDRNAQLRVNQIVNPVAVMMAVNAPQARICSKFAEIMWHKAAMAAMFEAKKDRIKSRLEKSFGPTLDKGADAVVEAISKKLRAAVQSSKNEQELHQKLASILTEATN